ncbi:MAG: pyrroline-5-carboxylate reductase [Bacteroidales bacterium]|nr:pyrroline-5-carboxylate reductase [Bacteroidales bacterium]
MSSNQKIAIIGGGNIGMSLAEGMVASEHFKAENIIITRKKSELPANLREGGFYFQSDNVDAVRKAHIVIFTILPQIMPDILKEVRNEITNDKIIISVAAGVKIKTIAEIIGKEVPIIRAMPNTAIKIRESMTCIAGNDHAETYLEEIKSMFDMVGVTLIIEEELIPSATALGSCGIAFFLRSIRAASQGGTQIGFHAEEAQLIAAQTAKGAAQLLLLSHSHPEDEIDKVTTPRGITIAGLNEMEHNGFSSALIKGIVKSYDKSKK